MGFKTKISNEKHFAPLEVKIYPDVTGGHPKDRIVDIEIYIDGEILEHHYGYLKKNFDAGEHSVKFVAHSKMGHSIAHEEVIHVVENQVPVCEPTLEELERFWVVHPNCTDSDGKVRRYHWTLDDEPPFKERGSLELSKRYYPNLPQISFQAEDDFYDKSPVYVVEH